MCWGGTTSKKCKVGKGRWLTEPRSEGACDTWPIQAAQADPGPVPEVPQVSGTHPSSYTAKSDPPHCFRLHSTHPTCLWVLQHPNRVWTLHDPTSSSPSHHLATCGQAEQELRENGEDSVPPLLCFWDYMTFLLFIYNEQLLLYKWKKKQHKSGVRIVKWSWRQECAIQRKSLTKKSNDLLM